MYRLAALVLAVAACGNSMWVIGKANQGTEPNYDAMLAAVNQAAGA